MGQQFSVDVNNAKQDAIETAIGTAPLLRFYDGAMPANCATAAAGTQIASQALPSDWLGAAVAGVKSKSGSWAGTFSAAGLARYARIYDSTGTTCHWQFLVSQAWQGSTSYVLNQHTNNGGNVYRCTTAGASASSGGPTGTGTSITDGAAVWAYVGTVDMVMDNTNSANGQSWTVTSFTNTASNQ